MPRKLRSLLLLQAAERALLARAWSVLWVASLGLRWGVPLARLRRVLAPRRPSRLRASRPGPERLAWLVAVAARHHPCRTACLERALCLEHLLRRGGADAELRIGVRRKGIGVEAHAWVEHLGRPVAEEGLAEGRFEPLSTAAHATVESL